MKKYLYNPGSFEPCCALCEHGLPQENGDIVCKGKRVRNPEDSCRRFRYDPLKRRPKPTPPLPAFDPEEFQL